MNFNRKFALSKKKNRENQWPNNPSFWREEQTNRGRKAAEPNLHKTHTHTHTHSYK